MRLSELLASRVVDERGRDLGPVRDVRLSREGLHVTGLVLGTGRLAGVAHAWGYAEGRAQGPWLFRVLTRAAAARAEVVPAARVLDWGPGTIRVRGPAA